ncbi:MAG: hypothetical protein ABSF92_12095 [Candidatus Acidiferrales bacterium]|jgi:hypothetical protein
MKNAMKVLIAIAVAFVLSTLDIPYAFAAITLTGTLPGGTTPIVLIQPNKQTGTSGVLKFKFSAPKAGNYALDFCIGPATNPCGLPTSFVVNVPGGQERLAVVNASFFANNELVVAQGTTGPIPFEVTIE